MEFKRSTWLYKISMLGRFESTRDNLCNVFWGLVARVMMTVLVICFMSTLGYVFYTDFWFRFASAVILYIAFSGFISWLAVHLLREKLGKSPEIPGSNIVIEYLKAKKAKICPFIEYVD